MEQVTNQITAAGNSVGGFLTHISDLLFQNLTKLAEAAGIVLQRLWVILTRQQLVLGLQQLLTGLALLIGSFITYRFFSNYNKDKKMNNVDRYGLMIIFFVLTLFFVINGVRIAIGSLPMIINPEYYALQESVKLLNQVKP